MPRAELLDRTIARWGALGAGFEPDPIGGTPDIERLLLDTARCAAQSARLVSMCVTWLRAYADLVATHRLRRLILDELDPRLHATMGFLLDASQEGEHQPAFASITKRLSASTQPAPLFTDQTRDGALSALAQRRASPISAKWGVWAMPIEFKHDALRPAHWLMRTHPNLVTRADLRGDLRASVLAALRFDAGAGDSEVALAKAVGGSRSQVRNALANLEMTGRVTIRRAEDANRNIIALAA